MRRMEGDQNRRRWEDAVITQYILISEQRAITVLALSINSSINSQNCFFEGFGDHNFVPFVDITPIYCTV